MVQAENESLGHVPYPWPEPLAPTPDPLDTTLVSVSLTAVPLSSALELLSAVGRCPVRVDPAAVGIVDASRVTVDLGRATARRALAAVLAETGLVHYVEKGTIWVSTSAAGAAGKAPEPFSVAKLAHPDRQWIHLTRQLLGRRFTFNFEGTALEEVARFYQDVIRDRAIDFAWAKGVDRSAPVTAMGQDVRLRDLLLEVLGPLKLSFGLRDGHVWIGDGDNDAAGDPERRYLEKVVSLDCRGVRVPSLVQALAAVGVEAVATREAWFSAGTVSIVARGEPLGEVLERLCRSGSLSAVATETDGPSKRHLVLLAGSVPSAHAALTREPLPFAGLVADVRRRRGELAAVIASRTLTRATSAALLPPARPRVEQLVQQQSEEILARLERARSLRDARPALARAEARLAIARDRLAPFSSELQDARRRREEARRAVPPGINEGAAVQAREHAEIAASTVETRHLPLEVELEESENAVDIATNEVSILERLEAGHSLGRLDLRPAPAKR